MTISILQLLEGARQACGLTVIIDVFRAFSVACYAVGAGVSKIYPVADIEEAWQLKRRHPDWLLVGERNERRPEGFDCGNSPSQLLKLPLTGKKIIHTTSSGTQGIVAATGAREIITGSFVNADAIVKYILQSNPAEVSLVCMGYATLYPTAEDTLCAEYIAARLRGQDTDFEAMKQEIKATSGARFFAAENQAHAPIADFELCTRLSVFDFVLQVEKGGDGASPWLRKIEV